MARSKIDLLNDAIQTSSIEIVNNMSKIFIITRSLLPAIQKLLQGFLIKTKINDKAVLIVGDLSITSLDSKCNESVKNLFNLVFQKDFLPLIQRPTTVTKTTATSIDHIATEAILENKMQSHS